jgi:O-antigen/teichoic acid export membrane protein
MTPSLRVFKNSFALSLSVLIERGVAFILPWYIARILGREVWGDFSTAYAYVLIAATIAPWGLVGLLPRQVAREQQRSGAILVNASIIGLGVSLLTVTVTLLLVTWLNYPSQLETLIYLGVLLVIIPQTEATLFETVIQGLERMEWIVFVRLPGTVLRVAASLYLLENGYGIEILFLLLGLYYAINSLLYFLILRRALATFGPRPSWLDIRLLFVQALPFFLIISSTEAFKQVDRIFLSAFWDSDAVGVYATGIMFTQLVYMLAPAVMGALFPGLSRTYVKSRERFSYLLSWLFKLLLIIIFPLMLFTISFAGPMIQLVFGPEYGPSIVVLQITALGILPSFLSRLLYRATLASDNERLALYIAIVSNVGSLLLNIFLIPRYGVIGASAAAVIVILINLSQNFWYVTRFARFDFRHGLLWPGLCAVIAGLVYLASSFYSLYWAFALATAVFLATLLLTGTLGREDLVNLQLVKR